MPAPIRGDKRLLAGAVRPYTDDMTTITVAALQLAFSADIDANIRRVSELVREAAGRGAEVILPPELFEGESFSRV